MSSEATPVRLVEWNVAMSLQSKAHLLSKLAPTIAVLPESAQPEKTGTALKAIGVTSTQWIGSNLNKGLLAASFGEWALQLDDSYDPGYQWVMPLHAFGPKHIRLLAVWDMNHRGGGHESAKRLGACRASIEHYDKFLRGGSDLTVISGDFNNSVYWDKPASRVKFGDFMDDIESRGYVSAYHAHHGCQRGAEPHPTLWWMKNATTTYHIDYTFVSRREAVGSVWMGSHADWITHSDHSPMVIDLAIGGAPAPTRATAVSHPDQTHTESSFLPKPERAADHKRKPAVQSRQPGAHNMRFPIEPGSLHDMVCGVNGEDFTQSFRPTHFTAEWNNGALAEVRIWGPRVLKDGSLGERLLDHRWHDVRGSGPVRCDQLPAFVAKALQSYAGEHSL